MMLAIGPIAMLCISRTIEKGKLAGLAVGFGAATADGIYGFVAAFGLTVITNFLVGYDVWIRSVGGLFLIYLGIKTYLTNLSIEKIDLAENNWLKNYLTTFFLTLTSPMTILMYMTVFAGLGLIGQTAGNYLRSSSLVLGIFLGAIAFYFILASIVDTFRLKLADKYVRLGHKLSGVVIGGFGTWAVISTIF